MTDSTPPTLLQHADAHGRVWFVLHTAEVTYLEVMRRQHPDITEEHARDEWPELLEDVHRVGPTKRPNVERWRAGPEFDRVYLVVEVTATGNRVLEVLPEHGRRAARAPTREASPAPAAADHHAPRSQAREPLPRGAGAPGAGLHELGLLAAVDHELRRGTPAQVSTLQQRVGAPAKELRHALGTVQGYREAGAGQDAPQRAEQRPARAEERMARALEGVEVMVARRRPVPA